MLLICHPWARTMVAVFDIGAPSYASAVQTEVNR
ncbi:hypothetical protein BH09PSE5_BH09PSE5_27400 [soil metagenome]